MRLLKRITPLIPPVLAVVGALAVIQVTVSALKIPPYVLPLPSAVFQLILTSKIPWWVSVWATLSEAVLGFLLAVALGIFLALAIVLSRTLRSVIGPLIVAAQVIPKVAFVPILFLWLGLSPLPRILTVVLVCFFPVVIDTVAGLDSAERGLIDLVRSYAPGKLTLMQKVRLPAAAPSIFAGLKVSVTLAMVGAVVAEFVQSSEGLGYLILSSQAQLNTTLAFASATLLVLMGFLLYGAVALAERVLVPWRRRP